MLDIFKQAAKDALASIGEGAFLRGTVLCNVNIEHGVQVTGHDENIVFERAVATLDASLDPKVGDSLTHPDGNFVLDALMNDSGSFRRFIVRKV